MISTLARLKKTTAFVDQTKVVVKRDSEDTTLKTYETIALQIYTTVTELFHRQRETVRQQNSEGGYCSSTQAFVSDSLEVNTMKECGVGNAENTE